MDKVHLSPNKISYDFKTKEDYQHQIKKIVSGKKLMVLDEGKLDYAGFLEGAKGLFGGCRTQEERLVYEAMKIIFFGAKKGWLSPEQAEEVGFRFGINLSDELTDKYSEFNDLIHDVKGPNKNNKLLKTHVVKFYNRYREILRPVGALTKLGSILLPCADFSVEVPKAPLPKLKSLEGRVTPAQEKAAKEEAIPAAPNMPPVAPEAVKEVAPALKDVKTTLHPSGIEPLEELINKIKTINWRQTLIKTAAVAGILLVGAAAGTATGYYLFSPEPPQPLPPPTLYERITNVDPIWPIMGVAGATFTYLRNSYLTTLIKSKDQQIVHKDGTIRRQNAELEKLSKEKKDNSKNLAIIKELTEALEYNQAIINQISNEMARILDQLNQGDKQIEETEKEIEDLTKKKGGDRKKGNNQADNTKPIELLGSITEKVTSLSCELAKKRAKKKELSAQLKRKEEELLAAQEEQERRLEEIKRLHREELEKTSQVAKRQIVALEARIKELDSSQAAHLKVLQQISEIKKLQEKLSLEKEELERKVQQKQLELESAEGNFQRKEEAQQRAQIELKKQHEALSSEIEQLRLVQKEHKANVEGLQKKEKELQTVTLLLEEKVKSLEQLEEQKNQLASKLEELKAAFEIASEEREAKIREVEKLSEELASGHENFEKQKNELEVKLQESLRAYQQKKEELDSLEATNKGLRAEVERLQLVQEENEEIKELIQKKEKEISSLKELLQRKASEVEEFRKQNSQFSSQIKELEASFSAIKKEADTQFLEHKSSLEELSKSKESLTKQLQDKENELGLASQAQNAIKAQLIALQAKNQDFSAEIELLKKTQEENKKTEAKLSEKEKAFSQVSAALAKEKQEIENSKKQCEQFVAQIQELTSSQKEKEQQLKEQQQSLEKSLESLKNKEAELREAHQKEMEEKRLLIEQQQKELGEKREALKISQSEEAELRKQIEAKTEELKKAQQESLGYQQQILDLGKLKSSLELKEKEIADLNEKVSKLEKSASMMQDALEASIQQAKAYEATSKAFEETMERVSFIEANHQAQLKELQEKLEKDHQKKIEELRGKIEELKKLEAQTTIENSKTERVLKITRDTNQALNEEVRGLHAQLDPLIKEVKIIRDTNEGLHSEALEFQSQINQLKKEKEELEAKLRAQNAGNKKRQIPPSSPRKQTNIPPLSPVKSRSGQPQSTTLTNSTESSRNRAKALFATPKKPSSKPDTIDKKRIGREEDLQEEQSSSLKGEIEKKDKKISHLERQLKELKEKIKKLAEEKAKAEQESADLLEEKKVHLAKAQKYMGLASELTQALEVERVRASVYGDREIDEGEKEGEGEKNVNWKDFPTQPVSADKHRRLSQDLGKAISEAASLRAALLRATKENEGLSEQLRQQQGYAKQLSEKDQLIAELEFKLKDAEEHFQERAGHRGKSSLESSSDLTDSAEFDQLREQERLQKELLEVTNKLHDLTKDHKSLTGTNESLEREIEAQRKKISELTALTFTNKKLNDTNAGLVQENARLLEENRLLKQKLKNKTTVLPKEPSQQTSVGRKTPSKTRRLKARIESLEQEKAQGEKQILELQQQVKDYPEMKKALEMLESEGDAKIKENSRLRQKMSYLSAINRDTKNLIEAYVAQFGELPRESSEVPSPEFNLSDYVQSIHERGVEKEANIIKWIEGTTVPPASNTSYQILESLPEKTRQEVRSRILRRRSALVDTALLTVKANSSSKQATPSSSSRPRKSIEEEKTAFKIIKSIQKDEQKRQKYIALLESDTLNQEDNDEEVNFVNQLKKSGTAHLFLQFLQGRPPILEYQGEESEKQG